MTIPAMMRRQRLLRSAWLCCTLVLASSLAGCGTPSAAGPADTYGLDFSLPEGSKTSGAIIFLVDGLNGEFFEQMLNDGELPAFKKYFVDRGLYAPRAVANVPSITLVNLTSIATGRFAGHHGIVANQTFDRNRLMWRDYETIAQKNTLDDDYIVPTVFEMLPGETTVSVFFQPHRKATKFIENWTSAGPPFYFGWFEFVDRLTLFRLSMVGDIARHRRAWPAVTVVYLLAPDFRAYLHGFSSPQYREAILHADRQIGRVCGDLERAGLLDKLHIAVVSDHGHADVQTHFPLRPFFKRLGLEMVEAHAPRDMPFEKLMAYYEPYSAVAFGGGDRYFALSLRKPAPDDSGRRYEAWNVRPDAADLADYPVSPKHSGAKRVDLIAELIARAEIDAVAFRNGDNCVRVARGNGEVEFRQPAGPGGDIGYHVLRGEDPFGWAGKVPAEALDGKPLSPRAWLEATHATEYPDLPAQIVAYFRSRYAPDLIAFSVPGTDLFAVHKAGHGGLRPADMFVPLLVAGPGVPHGRVDAARSVDVIPTVLQLQGRQPPPGLDGASIVPTPATQAAPATQPAE